MHNFETPSSRWQALVTRNPAANGTFVYCVLTTHIYCRPTCPARLARRANVEFFSTSSEAEAAGYRACKRCRPDLATHAPETDKINAVCQKLRDLEPGQQVPKLEDMAAFAGLTKSHFHRSFKRVMGVTPKAYLEMIMRERDTPTVSPFMSTDRNLSDWCESTTMSNFDAEQPDRILRDPCNSTSSSSDLMVPVLQDFNTSIENTSQPQCRSDHQSESSMTNGHQLVVVHYAITSTALGTLSVAFSNGDICMLDLCDTAEEALDCLKRSFEPAVYDLVRFSTIAAGHEQLDKKLNAVVEALERPSGKTMFLSHQVIFMGQKRKRTDISKSL
ncbi:hypothetical protein KCU99_g8571, partial [Aureobasidium melanogenum]